MLIKFSISNFLSINEKQTFSMEAGKARKHSDRIYREKGLKLTKCQAIFGANASGKSNFIEAFQFIRHTVIKGLPSGISNKYFRLIKENQSLPSTFEIEVIIDNKHYLYGFSVILNTRGIQEEWLYQVSITGIRKLIFKRNLPNNEFIIGGYFKTKDAISKLENYGFDTLDADEVLFLKIMTSHRAKMFSEIPELKIFKDLFDWFAFNLNITNPSLSLKNYPYFTESNIDEIGDLLNALGTGVSNLKFVEIQPEVIKTKLPEDLYSEIASDLDKLNKLAKKKAPYHLPPGVVVRGAKEFYIFEINQEDTITIKTIEFIHENNHTTYFKLNEESDGTARLLDLVEILLQISNNQIFVIDELDRCLHPSLTTKIVELFLEMAKKRNAQLIITCHEARLLENDLLRNDEICFILKMPNGASIVNPLEKYQLRADKKLYAALFDGTLDAVPDFDEEKLGKVVGKSKTVVKK